MRQAHGIRMPDGPFTRDFIMASKSPSGGWSRDQLAAWGIGWPPPKGWIDRLVDGEVR